MVNIGNMMKQAQELQKKMSDVQEKLKSIEVEGTSGGGMVKVISNAKGDIKRIMINDSLFKPEEKEITEDLIVAAINDAKQKGEVASQEEMKNITGGLPLPPGMKMPF
jgi:DNA-binding YbaB/EbfC family protein|tara:strand:- start:102 stop:425 length:324 start_codon:yes stop_codon:yes gene_type:complete